MNGNLPPLIWLRAFEASARHLSFTRAAADLNLTATAVSYQVRSLELHLHRPLFERLPRGLRLTEMGAAYLPDVRRAFEDIAATTTKLFGHGGTGKVTIRAPVSFFALWLAPRLRNFRERHPEIDILLLSTVWADAQPDPSVDIDIRFGTGNWPGYAAELLLHENSVAIGAAHLAVKGGNCRRLDAVFADGIIHVVGHENHWAEVFRRLGAMPPTDTKSLRVDNSVTAVSVAASAGGRRDCAAPLRGMGDRDDEPGPAVRLRAAGRAVTPFALAAHGQAAPARGSDVSGLDPRHRRGGTPRPALGTAREETGTVIALERSSRKATSYMLRRIDRDAFKFHRNGPFMTVY
ncbi:MAG: LysR family transcriptional regulator [Acidiphilium sp.]